MKQVLQNIRDGRLSVAECPAPIAQAGRVVIANSASLISAGTEKMVMDLAGKSLLGKARERPDHVRRVLEKVRNEGLLNTVRAVREKLDEPMSMGYSCAGTVLACGRGVEQYKPGDRVASNGGHAEIVSVPQNLCAAIPGNVGFDHAAFAVLGAIALQGVRLAETELGETVLVIGLGLVGQLAVSLLNAAGVQVIGTDPDEEKCRLALQMGASVARSRLSATLVEELSGGAGADAVLITASTKSNGPIELAAAAVRKRGRVVLVGVVGLELDRRPFYFKEAEFVVSCSYGPGRYDSDYEEFGRDYPLPYVRWTEQRNISAVLQMMSRGRLDVEPLISHRFAIEDAENAYGMIKAGTEPFLGVLLQYDAEQSKSAGHTIWLKGEKHSEQKPSDSKQPHAGPPRPAPPHPSPLPRGGGEGTEGAESEHVGPPHTEPPHPGPLPRGGGEGTGGAESEHTGPPHPGTLPRDEGEGTVRKMLRVGVLGAGNFARMVLIPRIVECGDFEPTVLCSAAGVNAVHSGQKHGFHLATTDESEVLNASDVDVVFVVTQHHLHAPQVLRAIQTGKHVFVEKPLCLTIDELTQIEAALTEAGDGAPIVMVGFNRRFAPIAQQLKAVFSTSETPITTSFRFNAGAIPVDHWTQNSDIGGGRLIGEACHAIDFVTWLTGSVPVRVYAESIGGDHSPEITDDQCFITLRHANGSVSNIAYLAGGDKACPKERVEVMGGGKTAVLDDFRELTVYAGGKRKVIRGRQDKGHGKEVQQFAECIARGTTPPISWQELRATTQASILAVQSLREGMPLTIP